MLNQENEFPMGFRFHPTPLELIEFFLYRKLMGLFSVDIIKDLDVYQFHPDQLPLGVSPQLRTNEGYFFAPKEKLNSQRRETPNGYWQIRRENVPVYNLESKVVGFKNRLSFHSNGIETDWRMSEYICNIDSNDGVKDKYIICKIRFKVNVDEADTFIENVEETFDDLPEEFDDLFEIQEDNVAR